jgi:hypothetical protein
VLIGVIYVMAAARQLVCLGFFLRALAMVKLGSVAD